MLELLHRGDSNKYPQNMFLGVNKGKKAFYHLSYWYMLGFFIVAFVLMAESWGTNVVVITRSLCTKNLYSIRDCQKLGIMVTYT